MPSTRHLVDVEDVAPIVEASLLELVSYSRVVRAVALLIRFLVLRGVVVSDEARVRSAGVSCS